MGYLLASNFRWKQLLINGQVCVRYIGPLAVGNKSVPHLRYECKSVILQSSSSCFFVIKAYVPQYFVKSISCHQPVKHRWSPDFVPKLFDRKTLSNDTPCQKCTNKSIHFFRRRDPILMSMSKRQEFDIITIFIPVLFFNTFQLPSASS